MPDQIETLLHRRTDLSTFLVHLSRTSNGVAARDRLLSILGSRQITAGGPFGMGAELASRHESIAHTQRVVCFTETPLEHVWMQCREVEGRQMKFEPYGLAVTRTWGRINGANPVMYIDITPTGRDWLTNPINALIDTAESGQQVVRQGDRWIVPALEHSPILMLLPFFEQMGKPKDTRKEFWWEREWRKVGDLSFTWSDLVAVFVPDSDHAAFRSALAHRMASQDPPPPPGWEQLSIIDPRWGLERIIASLAGVPEAMARPFPC